MGKTTIRTVTIVQENLPNIKNFVWIVGLFITMRVLISIVGAFAIWNNGDRNIKEPNSSPLMIEARSLSLEPKTTFNQLFINNWSRWDTGWYIKIAVFGQQAEDNTGGILPLYPLVIRLSNRIFGINYLLSALLVSNLFCLISLTLFFYITWRSIQFKFDCFSIFNVVSNFSSILFLVCWICRIFISCFSPVILDFFSKQEMDCCGSNWSLASITRSQGFLLSVPITMTLLSNDLVSIRNSITAPGHSIRKIICKMLELN